MNQPETIKLNGTSYQIASLSESARSQVHNIKGVDAEIVRHQNLIAMFQTAKNTYLASLAREIESKSPSVA